MNNTNRFYWKPKNNKPVKDMQEPADITETYIYKNQQCKESVNDKNI